jgi:hypothetical protein
MERQNAQAYDGRAPSRFRQTDLAGDRRVMMHRGGTRETIAFMTNPHTIERVRELRQRGRTPKEIARALGCHPPGGPDDQDGRRGSAAREAALVGCWVSEGWAAGLTVTGHPEWTGARGTAESGQSGLVTVLVARETGSRVSVCGYLVDCAAPSATTTSTTSARSLSRRRHGMTAVRGTMGCCRAREEGRGDGYADGTARPPG